MFKCVISWGLKSISPPPPHWIKPADTAFRIRGGITSEGNADLSKQVPETSTWGNLPGQNENNRSA